VARVEKPPAIRHHLCRVARCRVPRTPEQVDVTLPGDVEAVFANASQCCAHLRQRLSAVRAGQQGHNIIAHTLSVAASQ